MPTAPPPRRPPPQARARRAPPAARWRGVSTGILTLFHGDDQVGENRIRTQPGSFGLSGTDLTVGRSIARITDDYPGQRPWRFTGGTIKAVAVDVSGEPYIDLERAAAAMIARE